MDVVMEMPNKEPYQYEKVAEKLMEMVQQRFEPGDRFFSENILVEKFSVAPVTVRKALDILSDQGLIQRRHRRGTVVLDPLQHGEFAIVIRPQLLESDASPFFRETASLLSGKIREYNNFDWSSKLHLGEKVDRSRDYPATLDILKPDVIKTLRGVFSFHPLWELRDSLKQKRIPFVHIAALCSKADALISYDRNVFYRETLQYLRTKGCKTIGFGCGRLGPEDERRLDGNDKIFAENAVEAGFSIRDKWMLVIPDNITENKSYECFMKYWEQDSHPDAIVIDDDVMACGILRAILHKQIRIPEQIRLVTFANKGVSLPYHLPVTRYEYDMDKTTTAALDAMVKLLNGQKLEQNIIYVSGELIEGETA